MKRILLLGAGHEQAIAIREAKSLGLYVTVADGNPMAPGLSLADKSNVLDIRDVAVVEALAKAEQVNGIFCHAVEIPQVVATVAERMALPGLAPEIAQRATNKIERITWLKKNNIPCANFLVVKTREELAKNGARIGFPLVLKPVDNAGSRGVRVVDNGDALVRAYEEARAFSQTESVLLEEMLSGPQISTESIVYAGRVYTFAFADRNYVNGHVFYPHFIEDGINFPTILPPDVQDSVCNLVEKTIRCLGINFGAAKGDIIIDNGMPKIIEMAARTSGGWFGAGSIPIATGINMLKPLIQMSVGDPPDLEALKPTRRLGCAQRYVIPRESGVVAEISGLEEAGRAPGVAMATMFLPSRGTRIKRATNHAERFGQIICTGPTREEAIERCESAIAKIQIHLINNLSSG